MLNSYSDLQFWCDRALFDVFSEVVRPPALAGPRDQEPVVVESNLEATDLVIAVADLRRLLLLLRCGFVGRHASSLLKVLLVLLEVLQRRRGAGLILLGRVGVEDLGDEQRKPSR